jgi:hypothetical protein
MLLMHIKYYTFSDLVWLELVWNLACSDWDVSNQFHIFLWCLLALSSEIWQHITGWSVHDVQYSMVVSSPRVRMSSTNHSVTWHHIQGQWRPQIHCGEDVKKIAFLYYSGYCKCKYTPSLTAALHISIENRVKLKLQWQSYMHWHDSGSKLDSTPSSSS